MTAQLTLKDPARERRLIRRRLAVALALVVAGTVVLLAGLARLQLLQHDHFRTLSRENRVKVEPISPPRGLIFSREGVVLAENRPSFSLEATPERIRDLEAELEALQHVVSLDAEAIARFRDALEHTRRFESVPVKLNLTHEEVARFSVDQHRYPGFEINARARRYYPAGREFAHVIGYVGRIDERELEVIDRASYSGTTHIGKSGVEKAYEPVLHGEVGYRQAEVNAMGRVIRVLEHTPPVPGRDLYLTIDFSLQSVALEALGERRGAVVAIDPDTGGVLAMVSHPGFDPNLFVDGIGPEAYRQLRDSPARPLFNRALQGQYPPGSTVKPIVGLAGLHYGVRAPQEETWCPGWYSLPGSTHRYRDWKREGHGHVNLRMAIARSCDVYFYRLAEDLGISRLHDFMHALGFGRTTGIDLPGEAGGLMPSAQWKRRTRGSPWYPGETLITGIGQGFTLATPLQLAAATTVLARRGSFIQPHVVGEIEDAGSHEAAVVETAEWSVMPEIPRATWERIASYMEAVVHGERGTARRVGQGAGYHFAGKTGTSQLFALDQDQELDEQDIAERLRDHALFIAFAPAEQPIIAVAVLVENGGSGSKAAAPIARRMFDHYLRAQYAADTSGDDD